MLRPRVTGWHKDFWKLDEVIQEAFSSSIKKTTAIKTRAYYTTTFLIFLHYLTHFYFLRKWLIFNIYFSLIRTHRTLSVKELANAVLELVEQHGIQSWTELQSKEILNIGANMEAHPVVATNQQSQQPVQEAAHRCLTRGRRARGGHEVGHLTRAHRDHGVFTLGHGTHRWTVCGWAWGAALLEAHTAQSTQKSCHVDPLLLQGDTKTLRPSGTTPGKLFVTSLHSVISLFILHCLKTKIHINSNKQVTKS